MLKPSGWPHQISPFHEGEQAVQQRLGVRDKLEVSGRSGVRDYLPQQHREFFPLLPFIVLGASDAQGQVWASILSGVPGFLQSPTERELQIGASLAADDPLAAALQVGSSIGLLGIELQTRRRNRLNGQITRLDEHGMQIAVKTSFGNCTKYIQQRDYQLAGLPAALPPPEQALSLDQEAIDQIAAADTFFIATDASATQAASPERALQYGADVSHRGGKPGFVRVDDAQTLTWPEFVGNYFFNTLGNLQLNPRAGLLFPDFVSGDLLYLTGQANIIWDGDEVAAYTGAQRLVRYRIAQVLRLRARMSLRWTLQQASPHLAKTGNWSAPCRTD
ncbi:MAG: pyridoxamine 5'-phosphate oxidase family protein [Burkholderiales bacterium]|nr:pyridoxamine 5'-phosphate oxidase family protein [Burkholderiales bacterium]